MFTFNSPVWQHRDAGPHKKLQLTNQSDCEGQYRVVLVWSRTTPNLQSFHGCWRGLFWWNSSELFRSVYIKLTKLEIFWCYIYCLIMWRDSIMKQRAIAHSIILCKINQKSCILETLNQIFLVCFGVEDKKDFKMKTFLFKHIWRKQPIIIEMTRGPFGNPALMRNDPLR